MPFERPHPLPSSAPSAPSKQTSGAAIAPQDPALLRRLLRDTNLPITEIAFATGWESLGTFGRIFRDITGMSPSAVRREAQASATPLDRVPACVLKAAQRPDLTTAVLEKRRRLAEGTNRS